MSFENELKKAAWKAAVKVMSSDQIIAEMR